MEKELWIYAHYNPYTKDIDYQLCPYERSLSSGDVLLEQRNVSFDTPADKELRGRLALAMKSQLREMRIDHHKEELELKEKINELLALEYKPEKETDTEAFKPAKTVPDLDDDIPF